MIKKINRIRTRSHTAISNNNLKIIDEIVTQGVVLGNHCTAYFSQNQKLEKICCARPIKRFVYKGIIIYKLTNYNVL